MKDSPYGVNLGNYAPNAMLSMLSPKVYVIRVTTEFTGKIKNNMQLKKCKCGAEVYLTVKIKHPWNAEQWYIVCYHCDYIGDKYSTETEARRGWNENYSS